MVGASLQVLYRGEPLELGEMVIDHMVPESFSGLDAAARTRKFQELGLDPSYDVRAYYKLVPACHTCNGRKSDRELDHRHIGLNSAITRKLVPEIEKNIATLQAVRTLTKAMFALKSGLAKGHFTAAELGEALEKEGLTPAALSPVAADAKKTAAQPTNSTQAHTTVPANVYLPLIKGSEDLITLRGVAELLHAIAAGQAEGDRQELANGDVVFVLRANGLYIKYMIPDDEIIVLSCHFG